MHEDRLLPAAGGSSSWQKSRFAGVFSVLVFFERSHPAGPTVRSGAASFGPGAGGVKVTMPFECPELFKPDFAHTEVYKDAVYITSVPVHADKAHFTGGRFLGCGRAVRVTGIEVEPGTIDK